MHLTLLASIPCKRYDFSPLCDDGRGGWVYSQVSADRYVANLSDFWLLLGLSIAIEPFTSDDYVESTRLNASMDGVEIGENTLRWKDPNPGPVEHGTLGIQEWMQDIDLTPTKEGLVTVEIHIKFKRSDEFCLVDRKAFCHITEQDQKHRVLSPLRYSMKKFLPSSKWNKTGRW